MRAYLLRRLAVLALGTVVAALVLSSTAGATPTASLSFNTDSSWTVNGSPASVVSLSCYAGFGAWTTALGINWISVNSCPAPPPEVDVYAKTFTIPGTPTAGSIGIAADNEVSLSINGTNVLTQADAYNNFHTVATVDISPYLHSGSNTIVAVVTNTSVGLNISGVVAHVSVTYQLPDTTAPTDSPVVPSGWSNSDATVHWNWSDGGSGIDPSNCPQSSTSSGEGAITLTTSCSDLAGNSASDSATVYVDKSGPTDAPVYPSGWSNTDATVAWNWTDNGSGIDASSCTQSSTSSGEGAITLTSTCTDVAGNTSSDSVTVHVDKTAPADAPVVPSGWNTSDATVDWNWGDSGSGVDPASCTQSSTSTGEGTITLTSSCTDLAGNTSSDSATVQVDKTAPAAAPAGPTGWHNTDGTVTWNWSDSGSGVDAANCTQSSTSSGEGTITLTATCSDVAGNTGSASATVEVDKTAPVAAPVAPTGWHNADQTVAWNWTDAGGSGLDPANCAQSSTSSGEGNAITVTSSCSDVAGNSSSASATVQVDKTAPVVSYSGGGTYTVDQTVSISCSSSDALSGVASDTCAGVSAPAWSLGLGQHDLSATATDNAGNQGSGSTSYTVKVDGDSLCSLVTLWAKNKGQANSLCTKIRAAEAAAQRGQQKTHDNNINAFDNEVRAQSGKGFTSDQAALLVQFAAAL